MENATSPASYIASLEQRLAALTAERNSLDATVTRLLSERDSLQEKAGVLSEELQALHSSTDKLASERDNLAGVVEKMQCELRELRRLLFGRKSERFIPSDPSQLKLDFEGVAELKEEREYAALRETAPVARKEPAPRAKRPAEDWKTVRHRAAGERAGAAAG